MRIIAFYLPQFHSIPENDLWWGKDFTEWTNVKAAKPLFDGHQQPKVPLNNNYYNLLDDSVKVWQADLAKKYGVYGFCYYHYWFGDGKMLLEQPMEQMLVNKEIDIPFCICWANEPWTRIWVGNEAETLIPQKYGDEKEWEKHFYYLLPFFQDERYITDDGKPIICIYRPYVIPNISKMIGLWRKLAIDSGLPGLTVVGKYENDLYLADDSNALFDYIMEWQPSCAKIADRDSCKNKNSGLFNKIVRSFKKTILSIDQQYGTNFANRLVKIRDRNSTVDKNHSYDDVWEKIIQMKPVCEKSIPGAFVRWDNSPRKHKNENLILGETPEKFQKYLSEQIKHAKQDYHTDMMFMFAWNEWAEGGYLEPDEENGYLYLEAIKNALKENGE
ncbi:MAG: glycoside hydrolase family 99-like domain-containing protein [Ruminococcus sp.]|nr:glycoside hydrolase family 99-like domain-containing protein [Candidatus Apopatosoma intestinale]